MQAPFLFYVVNDAVFKSKSNKTINTFHYTYKNLLIYIPLLYFILTNKSLTYLLHFFNGYIREKYPYLLYIKDSNPCLLSMKYIIFSDILKNI